MALEPGASPWLNYHHLLYFWTAVREGSISRAAEKLRLAQPTISAQIRRLEHALGVTLLERKGRTIALTDMGRVVYRYADDIFPVGRELVETLRGGTSPRSLRLTVGVANAVPKLIVEWLLRPAMASANPPFLICVEDNTDQLLARLATFEIDVVIADRPAPPHSRVKVFNHLLGASPVSFLAPPRLATRLRRRFPESLAGAPLLLPAKSTALRQSIDFWLERRAVPATPLAEFEDSALMKAFARTIPAAFPAPTIIERDVCRLYDVRVAGRATDAAETYYVWSAERRLSHPSIVAITSAARDAMRA